MSKAQYNLSQEIESSSSICRASRCVPCFVLDSSNFCFLCEGYYFTISCTLFKFLIVGVLYCIGLAMRSYSVNGFQISLCTDVMGVLDLKCRRNDNRFRMCSLE